MALKTWQLALMLLLIMSSSMISPCCADYWFEVASWDDQTVRLHFSDIDEAVLLSDYEYALSAANDVINFANSHGMDIRRNRSNIADEIMAHAWAYYLGNTYQWVTDTANPMDLTMNSEDWAQDTANDWLRRIGRYIPD